MSRLWQAITAPFRRGPRRPLAARQPARASNGDSPLGMEAIDMSLVNGVQRRNASLERVNTLYVPFRGAGSFAQHAETGVNPMPDDETYAARYHRAYMNNKGTPSNDR